MDIEIVTTTLDHPFPINQVFPEDVMQHILSFGHCNQNRSVCQQWNRHNIQNEENDVRGMYQSVKELCPVPRPRNTWFLLGKQRPTLDALQKQMAPCGPLRSLKEATKKCKQGDRVLVHPEYDGSASRSNWNDSNWSHWIRHLSFIGVCDGRSRDGHQCTMSPSIKHLVGEVLFENLYIDGFQHHGIGGMVKVTFSRCTIDFSRMLVVPWLASLEIRDCIVINSHCINKKRAIISISPWANEVIITNSTFKNVNECIRITRHLVDGVVTSITPSVRILITDNVFQSHSNSEHPVIVETGPDGKGQINQCVMSGNKWCSMGSTDHDVDAMERGKSTNLKMHREQHLSTEEEIQCDPFYFMVENAVVSYDGLNVVLRSVDKEQSVCSIAHIHDPERVVESNVSMQLIQHHPPMEDGRVKVVAGVLKGEIGYLIGVDPELDVVTVQILACTLHCLYFTFIVNLDHVAYFYAFKELMITPLTTSTRENCKKSSIPKP